MIADHPSFHLKPGTTPLLVSLPHCGELIPDDDEAASRLGRGGVVVCADHDR